MAEIGFESSSIPELEALEHLLAIQGLHCQTARQVDRDFGQFVALRDRLPADNPIAVEANMLRQVRRHPSGLLYVRDRIALARLDDETHLDTPDFYLLHLGGIPIAEERFDIMSVTLDRRTTYVPKTTRRTDALSLTCISYDTDGNNLRNDELVFRAENMGQSAYAKPTATQRGSTSVSRGFSTFEQEFDLDNAADLAVVHAILGAITESTASAEIFT